MRHGIVLFTCDRGITPAQAAKAAALRQAWAAGNRPGRPDIRVLVAARPSPGDLAAWAAAGATELLWGLPDAPAETVEAYLDRLASRISS